MQDDDFVARDDFEDADQLRIGNDGIFMLTFFSKSPVRSARKAPPSTLLYRRETRALRPPKLTAPRWRVRSRLSSHVHMCNPEPSRARQRSEKGLSIIARRYTTGPNQQGCRGINLSQASFSVTVASHTVNALLCLVLLS